MGISERISRFAFFILILFTAFIAAGLLSCAAKNDEIAVISGELETSAVNNIAERMRNLLESELSDQTEKIEQTEQTTTIPATEIISDTLPYEPQSIIETEETADTTNTTDIPDIPDILETSEPPQTESSEPTDISDISKAKETIETIETIETTENKTELYVITPSGKKYHYPHCRTVKQIKEHLSKEDAERQGYDACKICNPK